MLANRQNSFNCSEESCNNPFADNYISIANIYNLCSEEAGNMQERDVNGRFICKGVFSDELIKMSLCLCGCGESTITKERPMWRGIPKYKKGHHRRGQILSKETKLKLSTFFKGKHTSPDNEFKKGHRTWCTGKKRPEMSGKNHPFYGKKLPKETREKISLSRRGGIPWNKGKTEIYSEKTLQEMSKNRKGKIPWNKGKQCPNISIKLQGHIVSKEAREKMSSAKIGDKSPSWNGGTSFLPYCPKFNKPLKERIRKRDNHTCQLCGAKENGRKLAVHHIHYDKPNCDPDLIALCNGCNCKVNFNRDYHEELFMQKLRERGLLL